MNSSTTNRAANGAAPPAEHEPPTIVGEVSVTWRDGCADQGKPTIGRQFERMIEVNRERGYRLSSWQLVQTVNDDSRRPPQLVETIVAVFEREETQP